MTLIEERAKALAEAAVRSRERWVSAVLGVGGTPSDAELESLATIAAYRERYGVTGHEPLGGEPTTLAQRADRTSALLARSRQASQWTKRPARNEHSAEFSL
ncbi:hypothetical protein [Promicromonospora soli]